MKVLVIIPAYNESDNIVNTINMLNEKCPEYDYVIINDCSKDNTEEICISHGFNYISLPINLGIGGGVQTGYKYGYQHGYDIAVQFDGDGQHNAEYIKDICQPILDNSADMVIGSRFIKKEGFQTSTMRRAGIGVLKIALKLCGGVTITDATSGFRAVSRDVMEFFSNYYAQDYPEPEAIISLCVNGFRVKEVPVIMNERTAGVSSISPLKSIYYMIKVTLSIIMYRLIGKRVKK